MGEFTCARETGENRALHLYVEVKVKQINTEIVEEYAWQVYCERLMHLYVEVQVK